MAPTGSYDEETGPSVAAWQARKSLRVDGKVGPKTERAVDRELPAPTGAAGGKGQGGKGQGRAEPEGRGAKRAGAPALAGVAPAKGGPAGGAPSLETKGAATDGAQAPAPAAAEESAPPRAADALVAVGPSQGTLAEEGAQGPGLTQAMASLVGLTPLAPGVAEGAIELGPLVTWVQRTASAFSQAADVLASPTLSEPERTQLSQLMASQAALMAPPLKAVFEGVRARAIQLVNESSVLQAGSSAPTLPGQATTQALNVALRRLDQAVGAGALGKGAAGLLAASHVGQDALLAIAQGRSVLAARETWKKGIKEPKGDKVAAHRRKKDDPLNAIFADAGWSRYGVTATTTESGKKKVADWCGMFVAAHMFRGGGLDQELRAGMLHTTNVLDYFQYQQKANAARAPKSVWADGMWQDLKTYHGTRGSLRKWTTRAAITSAMESKAPLDIRPGDVVLIDHKGNRKSPQHITMVESYDPATQTLVTIEGNTGGIQAPDGKGKAADGTEWYENHRGADGSGIHRRDLTSMSAKSQAAWSAEHQKKQDAYATVKKKAGDDAASKVTGSKRKAEARKRAERAVYKDKRGATIFGIGRPSIVDFEEHEYASHAVPSAYQKMAPAEIRSLAAKRGKSSKAAKVGVLKPR